MTGTAVIQMALFLLQLVLSQFKQSPTASEAENLAIAGIQSAIDSLNKVHSTDVTFEQLESLRVKPTF